MIEFHAPGVDDRSLVTHLYYMLTGVMPSDASVQDDVDLIGPGRPFETQGDVLAFAASLPENTVHLVGLAGSVQALDPSWFPPG